MLIHSERGKEYSCGEGRGETERRGKGKTSQTCGGVSATEPIGDGGVFQEPGPLSSACCLMSFIWKGRVLK